MKYKQSCVSPPRTPHLILAHAYMPKTASSPDPPTDRRMPNVLERVVATGQLSVLHLVYRVHTHLAVAIARLASHKRRKKYRCQISDRSAASHGDGGAGCPGATAEVAAEAPPAATCWKADSELDGTQGTGKPQSVRWQYLKVS